jgi:hypothetical protein
MGADGYLGIPRVQLQKLLSTQVCVFFQIAYADKYYSTLVILYPLSSLNELFKLVILKTKISDLEIETLKFCFS